MSETLENNIDPFDEFDPRGITSPEKKTEEEDKKHIPQLGAPTQSNMLDSGIYLVILP